MLIGAITNVAGQFDNFDKVMNPVTTLMERLAPVIKILFDFLENVVDVTDMLFNILGQLLEALKPILEIILKTASAMSVIKMLLSAISIVLKFLKPIIEGISWAFEKLYNFLFGWFDDAADSMFDYTNSLIENQKEIEETTEQLKSLRSAIQEQEEMYIEMKKKLNSDTYASDVTNVHDMILTPHGTFRTDPDDTIMAMKHPETLKSNGNANVSIVINNSISDKADVQVTREQDSDGFEKMVVQISQKVATDYANGSNGWDNAVAYRSYKQVGRALS